MRDILILVTSLMVATTVPSFAEDQKYLIYLGAATDHGDRGSDRRPAKPNYRCDGPGQRLVFARNHCAGIAFITENKQFIGLKATTDATNQALNERLTRMQANIDALSNANDALTKRISELEALLPNAGGNKK
ncbi:MAG: hypothetical protein KDJ45_08845 [Hyphomicrobiaceae bacterium]|nr:hypothetical protein [Hyphomicrobiaceae bacterium]MCC0009775.1 hypothetical protein [Hyphomicrobiaceae bacterium]